MDAITIVGAGLAGCTAAALLKDRYRVTVWEAAEIGGLCRDAGGQQACGPHAFHADDAEVLRFLERFATFHPFDLHVQVLTDPWHRRDLPVRPGDDPAFRVYSEKAWSMPWEDLPESVRGRVPTLCTDGRPGYHAGKYRAQPVGGYSAMFDRMLDGCRVQAARVTRNSIHYGPIIWCGNINDYAGSDLPWIGRQWVHVDGGDLDGATQINYATHAIPALRAWHHGRINPYHSGHGIGFEFAYDGGTPCYPHPDPRYAEQAARIVADAKTRGHFLCGRMATYRYLDMDQTVRDVIDTIKEAGL